MQFLFKYKQIEDVRFGQVRLGGVPLKTPRQLEWVSGQLFYLAITFGLRRQKKTEKHKKYETLKAIIKKLEKISIKMVYSRKRIGSCPWTLTLLFQMYRIGVMV